MSTLAIPPTRVRLYRVLWDRWIIVLRILLDLGAGAHPVKWRAVADTLLVDKKTIQKYIAGLVRDGHITPAGDGYMLTQAGMDILLENEQGGEIPPSGEKIPGKNSQLLESVVVVNPELNTLTPPTTESGKNPGEKISPPQVGGFFLPEVQVALDHADILFDGATVAQNGLPHYLHIEKVLGWLAYAYDKRGALYGPAGLVRNKLKDAASPSPSVKYMKDPLAFFPDEYLSAIGKYHKVCDRCEQEFSSVQDYQAHHEACLMTIPAGAEDDVAEPDPTCLPDETISSQVLQVWAGVMDALRAELAPASFQTWVAGASPIHVDESVWRIGVRNEYARDWLSTRQAGRFQRLLGRSVEFVVAMETEE